jgi:hypothetical protein
MIAPSSDSPVVPGLRRWERDLLTDRSSGSEDAAVTAAQQEAAAREQVRQDRRRVREFNKRCCASPRGLNQCENTVRNQIRCRCLSTATAHVIFLGE